MPLSFSQMFHNIYFSYPLWKFMDTILEKFKLLQCSLELWFYFLIPFLESLLVLEVLSDQITFNNLKYHQCTYRLLWIFVHLFRICAIFCFPSPTMNEFFDVFLKQHSQCEVKTLKQVNSPIAPRNNGITIVDRNKRSG